MPKEEKEARGTEKVQNGRLLGSGIMRQSNLRKELNPYKSGEESEGKKTGLIPSKSVGIILSAVSEEHRDIWEVGNFYKNVLRASVNQELEWESSLSPGSKTSPNNFNHLRQK